jgi:hypothetical protein
MRGTEETVPCVKNKRVHFRERSACSHFLLILNQMNKAHVLKSYFFKIHFNIIIPSTPSYSKWILSFGFPYQNLICMSLFHTCATYPAKEIFLDLIVFLLLFSVLFY